MEKKLLNRLKDFVKTDSSHLSKEEADVESSDSQQAEQIPDITVIFSEIVAGQKRMFEETEHANSEFKALLKHNSELLEQMISELSKLTSISERFIYAMEALPKSSREQSERLSAIEDQLQYEGQTDKALLTNLDMLGKNVASLTRFAETQQVAQEQFIKNLQQQFEPLMHIINKQNRFVAMMLGSSVIIIILLGILILLVYKF